LRDGWQKSVERIVIEVPTTSRKADWGSSTSPEKSLFR